MAVIPLFGGLEGASSLDGSLDLFQIFFLGSGGIEATLGTVNLIQPFFGIFQGSGGINGGSPPVLPENLVGTLSGVGGVSGTLDRIVRLSGRLAGQGSLQWSYPTPFCGSSSLSGFLTVYTHTVYEATTCPSKCFRYLEFFQRGDLAVYIRNAAGPISPVRVVYTIYQKRPNGTRFQVGPSRLPVRGDVGEFYATGRAGEGGQPGDWVIIWEFQESLQVKPQTVEMTFRVSDAVMANDPRDATVRCRKYGWN